MDFSKTVSKKIKGRTVTPHKRKELKLAKNSRKKKLVKNRLAYST